MAIEKEDYEEPQCLLCMKRDVTPIAVGRMIEKLDEYLGRNDYAAAERHLCYWLQEAEQGYDLRGKLTVVNEQIGLYRKIGKETQCLQCAESALALAEQLELEGTITLGTTLVNAATGFKAFGHADRALPLYEKARSIYENTLDGSDARLGGLYNNMALALTELNAFPAAKELFYLALRIMEQQPHGEAEMAITYLNLADLAAAELGLPEGESQVFSNLDRAEALLDSESLPRDGYYAFVCEKCAGVFGYYGYFLTEQKLSERARRIYERS